MKKKKITGKLSLEKSKISKLNSSKIVGGEPSASGLAICNYGGTTCAYGSISDCDMNCTATRDGGSKCKCL